MNNNLINETSPYLIQHAGNPVNWYPWCDEAFEKSKLLDIPIFLSIGYSTCHWCHVMAHESFEDKKTAEILNNNFVCIKVDREERPDIDSVYMSVCQALTGNGGWPMSIFMTWDKKPFFAGTYFPPVSKYGMPGFPDLLNAVANQWRTNKNKLLKSAENIILHLNQPQNQVIKEKTKNLEDIAAEQLKRNFDEKFGGFGSAPKFPAPHNLMFLMIYSVIKNDPKSLEMAEKTLIQMRKGGIFDQIGFGFSRYSTDRFFLAPHFEKMLYDNALMIAAYSTAYSITQNSLYLDTAKKTALYTLREMTYSEGGFYSAQDADSEGIEGKFYTFAPEEIISVLGTENGRNFAQVFDITQNGNFEGSSIPNLLKSSDLNTDFSDDLQKLYEYRKKRAKLHIDDKFLLSWNAMMIAAMSLLYRVSKKTEYLSTAEKAQKFTEKNLRCGSQLYTSSRGGRHTCKGVLDDYAFYILALLELYGSTLDVKYLNEADFLSNVTISLFADSKNGGFYLSRTESKELFINPKETYDGAIPSGNSVMAYNFIRLYQITENEKYREYAEKQLKFMSVKAQDYPAGHCMFLLAKLIYDNPPEHITVVPKNKTDLKKVLEILPPSANVLVVNENEKYSLKNNKTTYYICRNHSCMPPFNDYVP